jgi:argininosuccinate lyase
MKGLASGYNRDQQEDRLPLLEAGPLARGAARVVSIALPHVRFDAERGRRALEDGFTQATDLAEALVQRGVPFREAYRAVGALVRLAIDDGIALRAVPVDRAVAIHPMLDARALTALDPARAVAAKESLGGTGPRSVAAQIDALRARAHELGAIAATFGSLDEIAARIFAEPLEAR